jgi:hypothetical protein
MVRWGALALGVIALTAFGSAFVSVSHPEAQDFTEEEVSGVSETELNTYIDVYSAMQVDHDLTIDDALVLVGDGMSLSSFRDLERRVQKEERLVERVRQALADNAKSRASSAVPSARQRAEDSKP